MYPLMIMDNRFSDYEIIFVNIQLSKDGDVTDVSVILGGKRRSRT